MKDPMRLSLVGLLAASLLDLGSRALGDDRPAFESDKVEFIKAMLRDLQPPELRDFLTEDGVYHHRPYKWVKWCEQFRADFSEQRGIEYVEPVARSDRYDDPVFKPWQDRCPALAFNARSLPLMPGAMPPGARGDWLRSLPRHMPDGNEMLDYQYGTRDFKLFQGDFDNDPDDDGAEEVIYFSDGFYSYWELIARDERFPLTVPPLNRNWNDVVSSDAVPADISIDISAEYRLLDLHHCRSSKLVAVWSPYYTHWPEAAESYNGLIKYRGQYFIFEFKPGNPYRLEIEALQPRRVPTHGHPVEDIEPPYCWFS